MKKKIIIILLNIKYKPKGPNDVRTILARSRTASMFLNKASSTPAKCLVPSFNNADWRLIYNLFIVRYRQKCDS